jgi:hypothetical protein
MVKTKVTLEARETKTVSLQLGQEMVVHRVETQQDGPVLIRIQKQTSSSPVTDVINQAQETFQEYVDRELPEHLAMLVEEERTEWEASNQQLSQAAESGDDEAFFSLLARDPRFLQSECTLRRILTWRTQIDTYNRYFRNQSKGSQFWQTDSAHHNEAHQAMKQAEENLRRLGQSQLTLYDQRGKRPLPPADKVRGIYYGLLCLLNGLRQLHKDLKPMGLSTSRIEELITNFVAALKSLHGTSPFLPFIIAGAYLISDRDLRTKANFHEPSLNSLFWGKGVTPSNTAKDFTAAALEVHVSTVERLCALNQPILLASTPEEDVYLGGCPNFDLFQDFPEILPLKSLLTR